MILWIMWLILASTRVWGAPRASKWDPIGEIVDYMQIDDDPDDPDSYKREVPLSSDSPAETNLSCSYQLKDSAISEELRALIVKEVRKQFTVFLVNLTDALRKKGFKRKNNLVNVDVKIRAKNDTEDNEEVLIDRVLRKIGHLRRRGKTSPEKIVKTEAPLTVNLLRTILTSALTESKAKFGPKSSESNDVIYPQVERKKMAKYKKSTNFAFQDDLSNNEEESYSDNQEPDTQSSRSRIPQSDDRLSMRNSNSYDESDYEEGISIPEQDQSYH